MEEKKEQWMEDLKEIGTYIVYGAGGGAGAKLIGDKVDAANVGLDYQESSIVGGITGGLIKAGQILVRRFKKSD